MSTLPGSPIDGFHDVKAVKEMKYTKLGNTDMVVSQMTFGASPFGNVYRSTDDKESHQVLINALKSGINLIDTAPWYGQGRSETTLGKILKEVPREAYYINTKVGRYELEFDKMFDFSAERVIKSVDESLERLGVDYLDVVQIHDMEFAPSLDVIINETLPALQKVKESGKAKHIGITGYPLENFKYVIEKSPVQIDTILTYCHGSLNDNTLKDFTDYFKAKGIGVINGSILSMGLLTDRGPPQWHPAHQHIKHVCCQAAQFCKDANVDISKIASNYSFKFPGVDTTLIGTASAVNFKKNLDVFLNGVSDHEQSICDQVVTKYFDALEPKGWHNVEVEQYQEGLKNPGSKLC